VNIANLLYAAYGNNIVIGRHIRRQLAHLREMLPASFLGRHMDDLGCGDGRVTVLLEEIFQPVKLRGCDVSPALVRMARTRGVDAEVLDLERDVPGGELAILWGVLHHLDDPHDCLRRVRDNYDMVCVREPLMGPSRICLELGSPLAEDDLAALLSDSLPGAQILGCRGCLIALLDQSEESSARLDSHPVHHETLVV